MNASASPPVRGLYLLTPDEADTSRLVRRVSAVIGLGVALLQYRNKSADADLRRIQALALLPVCAQAGVPMLVNDDWRLAADIGAAGAHLGEHDGELAQARVALGARALLGASCYDSIELARRARDAGASHVAFGAFFPSGTKPGARRAPLPLLAEARALGLPTVAIGGITPDNAPTVIAAGADLLAVLGAVFDAADPVARVRDFVSCFDSPPRPSSP